jgi:hypothetical protein
MPEDDKKPEEKPDEIKEDPNLVDYESLGFPNGKNKLITEKEDEKKE